jgi:hypothetical protein
MESVEHVVYIAHDAPPLAAASACFPYLPKSDASARLALPQGFKRVRVTITVEEIE